MHRKKETNTHYGMVFLKDGRSKLKPLEYSETERNLQNEFVFDGIPVEPNENYSAVLLAVKESEKIKDPIARILKNNPDPVAEIVEF